MKEKDFYSGLNKSSERTENSKLLGDMYKLFLTPAVLLVGGCAIVLLTNFPKLLTFFSKGNGDLLLFILTFIISLFILMRARQSILLASIDYSTVRQENRDFVTFVAVAVIFSVLALLAAFHNYISILYAIFALISLIAALNFWNLYSVRFEDNEEKTKIDYICEKKIQLLNVTVFFLLFLLFLFISILYALGVETKWIYISLATAICLLLYINIVHSRDLTYIPKFILSNKNEEDADAPKLRIERMGEKDTGRIVDTLFAEFKYVFEYIFDTTDSVTLKKALRSLVKSCFGFGPLGYMDFYSIKTNDGELPADEIGLIKIDTMFRCHVYKILEFFIFPAIAVSQFGIGRSLQIYRRSKAVSASQPKLQNKTEFELTYFVIHEKFRGNTKKEDKPEKYGTHAMNLLINALFHSEKTNNINCSKLILLIREHNEASLALFERKIGCTRYSPEDVGYDPLAKNESVGKGIFFQYRP